MVMVNDYECFGKKLASRLLSLYQMRELLEAMVDACPELAIQ